MNTGVCGTDVIGIIPMISFIFEIPMPYSSLVRTKVRYLPSLSAAALTACAILSCS
jgi:hypothetical protein